MSKTKVVYKGEKFFVNKKKKTVVCAIDFEINLLEIDAVQRMLGDKQFSNFIASISYDSEFNFGICKFKVSGKAKATDEDEFDEEFGRRLAQTRAQEKAFMVASDLYNEIADVLHKLVFRDVCMLVDGSEQSFWKCINHENDLINEKFHLSLI